MAVANQAQAERWDSAEHLKTDAHTARYWEGCLEEGRDGDGFITAALGNWQPDTNFRTGSTSPRRPDVGGAV